jgi:hypothetical protein
MALSLSLFGDVFESEGWCHQYDCSCTPGMEWQHEMTYAALARSGVSNSFQRSSLENLPSLNLNKQKPSGVSNSTSIAGAQKIWTQFNGAYRQV